MKMIATCFQFYPLARVFITKTSSYWTLPTKSSVCWRNTLKWNNRLRDTTRSSCRCELQFKYFLALIHICLRFDILLTLRASKNFTWLLRRNRLSDKLVKTLLINVVWLLVVFIHYRKYFIFLPIFQHAETICVYKYWNTFPTSGICKLL